MCSSYRAASQVKLWTAGFVVMVAGLALCAASPARNFSLFEYEDPKRQVVDIEQASGTARMVQRLQRIATEADPTQVTFLSDQRIELLREQLRTLSSESLRRRSQFDLALERLRRGQIETAIVRLKDLGASLASATSSDADDLRDDVEEILGVAYLRLGQQHHARHHPGVGPFLIPVPAGGMVEDPSSHRQAIELFESVLSRKPDNVTVRWLLNISYMAVGEFPDGVPEQWVVPESLFVSAGDLDPFTDIAYTLGLDVDGHAGGVVVEDLDRDGDLDIMCSSSGPQDQIRLFRNDGDGSFTDWTERSGLIGLTGGINMVHADYNNDGLPDVFVLRGAWAEQAGRVPNSLLENRGGLRFDDVTEAAGLLTLHPTQTASWADYNNDGWLDLFVGNESELGNLHASELFHNNGNGTFTECSWDQGLDVIGFVKAVIWGDYNNDGRPDLYVSQLRSRNLLFRNDGPGEVASSLAEGPPPWRFTEVARQAGVSEPIVGFPAWFFDYDNDGWQDLFVSSYDVARGAFGYDFMELEHRAEPARLYHNERDGTFADVTEEAGLDRLFLTMGSSFGDLDNDGFLDIYLGTGNPDLRSMVPNVMFLNDAGQRFLDVTTAGGFGTTQKGHAVAFADIDQDGDQDIYQSLGGAYRGDSSGNALFENASNGNHWVMVSLEGGASNRSALGARLRVGIETPSGPRDVHLAVNTGATFGSTSLRKTIGLGDATTITQLEILWPSGQHQLLTGIPLDHLVCVREGDDNLVIKQLQPIPFAR